MPDYNAPLKDMQFVLSELTGLDAICTLPAFQETTPEVVSAVLEQAARFAGEVLAPLNTVGDKEGARCEDNAVQEAPGFAEAYRQMIAGGWVALPCNPNYGGMGMPGSVAIATTEMWGAANTSFSLCPILGQGAINALESHASESLKNTFLPNMISGEWTGTMNLTEPNAGSDLAAVRTKAVPEGDHYRLSGTKIFITWGDHQMTDNIVHLVLARTPDAPEGVKGISLFVVPKFLVNADGSLGERNDVYAGSIEHKLGIHASPTCVMNYGSNEGAIGYLVGELNQGLVYMFTMMNHARLNVGVQGVALSERAYQQAVGYAKERVQGVAPGDKEKGAIIRHPDIRRMLMLMRALTEASRALCYWVAADFDRGLHSTDPAEQQIAQASGDLLTPIAKGWSTEVCQEVTSLGVQIHGGMGFIEETGAAQHVRDARIITIYEGTTGIQANDLVGRKLLRDNGLAFNQLADNIRATVAELESAASDKQLQTIATALSTGLQSLESAVAWLLENGSKQPRLPGAAAVNLLMAMGTVVGGWLLAKAALVASAKITGDEAFYGAKIITAVFYAQQIMPRADAYVKAAMSGCDSTMALTDEQF